MDFRFKKPGSNEYLEFSAELKDFHSKKVIYQKPEVWRLYIQVGDYRINFHKIFRSDTTELLHPHPWEMHTNILKGSCEVGFGYGIEQPKPTSIMTFKEGSSYEMTDPLLWHYVKPLSESILTVMVSGQPWEPKTKFNTFPSRPQPMLSEDEAEILWNEITTKLFREGL